MRPILGGLLGFCLLMWGGVASAALPKDKADAPDVVTATVQKVTTSEDRYDNGLVVTKHIAVIKIETVERTTQRTVQNKGQVLKAGDTVTVYWSQATRPSTGTVGHVYSVHEKEVIRAWLHPACNCADFFPIDNASAIETISRQKP